MDDLANPDDIEMAERCICGHTLGQHEYGDWDCARCDLPDCGCEGFHEMSNSHMEAVTIAKLSVVSGRTQRAGEQPERANGEASPSASLSPAPGRTMMLSYDPLTHRRCIACTYRRQPPLVEVLGAVFPNGAVLLACGHIAASIEEFTASHFDW